MIELEPRVAAGLADAVYDVQTDLLLKAFLKRPEFTKNTAHKQPLNAEVGGHIIFRTTDAFGICAMGGTAYERSLFIVFRGTNPKKNADLLTDARIGLQPSQTGLPVHIGFNQVFISMLPEIRKFIDKFEQQITTIHCIGHSLGGAVATLMADWIKSYKAPAVKLYTFGAPKVGLLFFNANLTRKLKSLNIHRAYHSTDPVPMIPLYPYVHSPLPGYGHYIPTTGNAISADSHSMKLYVDSVKGASWTELSRRAPEYNIESAVEQWLQSKMPVNEHTPRIYEWLNAALIYVLKKIIGAAALSLQAGIIGVHSLADTIAYMLQKGYEIYKAASNWVVWLMQKIMQVLGKKVPQKVEDLSHDIMRDAVKRIMQKAHEEASKAVLRI